MIAVPAILGVFTVLTSISLELRVAHVILFVPGVVSRTLSGLRLTVGGPFSGNREQRTISSEQRTIDRKQQAKAPKVSKVRAASKSASLFPPFVQHASRCSTMAVPMSIAYLDTSGAAAYLGLSKNTLEKWRLANQGPPYIRLGLKKVRYDPADLDVWRAGRRRMPAELGAGEGVRF